MGLYRDFGLSFLNRRLKSLCVHQYEPTMGEELLWGVKNGDLDKVRELVEKKGCNVNDELMSGRNPIHFAADYGQCEMIDYLINRGADMNGDAKSFKGSAEPLESGQVSLVVVPILLQEFRQIFEVPDKHGITPLLAAIYEGHTECVKLLLAKGAKKDGKSPSGDSYKDSAESQEIKDLL